MMHTDTHPLEPTDEGLLARIAGGDERALAAFHDRHRRLAHAVALRVIGDPGMAEDVVQDAFLAVWRRADSYLEARGSARTWLTSIVRNRAIDAVRARRERAAGDDEALLLGIRDPRPSPADQVATRLEGERVRSAVLGLPHDQQQAIRLAFFGGLSHAEIADRSDLPLGTVKSRIRLGMQRMRAALVADGLSPDSVGGGSPPMWAAGA